MGSLRENLETQATAPDRGITTDHSASKWGSMFVTGKAVRGNTFVYYLSCEICKSSGATISQDALNRGEIPVCRNSGCNKTSVDTRRQAQFGYDAGPQSPRERAEYAAREKAISEIGGPNE